MSDVLILTRCVHFNDLLIFILHKFGPPIGRRMLGVCGGVWMNFVLLCVVFVLSPFVCQSPVADTCNILFTLVIVIHHYNVQWMQTTVMV